MKRNSILPILVILITGLFAYSVSVHIVRASGTVYIRADGSVDPPTAPIASADNITYVFSGNVSESVVIERDNIIVNGAGHAVQGAGAGNGMTLTGRANVTISDLTITTFAVGILLTGSSNGVQIVGNSVTANGQTGILVTATCFHNSLIGNNVTKNPSLGIWLQGSTSNVLSDNNVTYNGDGIYIFNSFNNTLLGNVMEDNTYNFGVYGDDLPSFTQSIDTSNVVDDKPVYYLVNQSNTLISPETYPNVGYMGLVNCTNMTVQGLNPPSNVQGILLVLTSNSKIIGNNLASHGSGIYLWSSSNNILLANNVTNNGFGIVSVSSSNNSIFHNSFTNNPTQAHNEGLYANIWDDGYPSGGNFWNDYNGTDIYGGLYQNETGSDGIGDSNYTIDAKNIDHYPLVGTYNSYNVSWAGSNYTVNLISNSTVSAFALAVSLEHLEDRRVSFNVTGQNGTRGFCRICIPTALMNGSYTVIVNDTEVPYNLLACSNSTDTYLYFNYTHSTQKVVIIPEFPTLVIALSLFTMSTLLTVVFHRRKRSELH
jgi:parallel beta-helix repeat protein